MADEPTYHVFGIRHHGPGSARSVLKALETLQPDAILVEGPPDADAVLPLLAHEEMQPPVALLLYVPDEPRRAAFYPYALFSPEWQALKFGLTRGIPVRFMDLPQAHQLAMVPAEPEAEGSGEEEAPESGAAGEPEPLSPQLASPAAAEAEEEPSPEPSPREDPLGWLAKAAGYSDGERWWEHLVEQRLDGADLFAGIREAMAVLRQEAPPAADPIEALREAYMRQSIRQAQKEGYQRIAVVCGAWHAPALAEMPAAKEDQALLKGLPKVKIEATWVPWTYGRLSSRSGYGAGIESPGWYHHLWASPDRITTRWMTRVAHLLREEDLDASAAHVIEAVRLAETLAALRERPLPGLPEMNEAAQAIFCFGSDTPMRLISERLIVGDTLGKVPEATPTVPLQQDLQRAQRHLRLEADATQRDLDLDLRKPVDLGRSHLLHRLALLGIPWGDLQRVSGKLGTFHELWRIQWQPEFAVRLIEAGVWGNTIRDAATAFAREGARKAPDLAALSALLRQSLWADLPDAIGALVTQLQAMAALASDAAPLMDALPELAEILRYGNVRQTDAGMVGEVVDGLVARICVGLPVACSSLNDEAAEEMFRRLVATNGVVTLLQNEEHLTLWRDALRHLADQGSLHGVISGRCCRLLLDGGVFPADEAARRMSLALSTANEPAQAGAWVDGFLRDSGILLLHDETLWQVIDRWVTELSPDAFTAVLPLLRRTFTTFEAPVRRQMGERVRHGGPVRDAVSGLGAPADFDTPRAEAVLPLVAKLLGLGGN